MFTNVNQGKRSVFIVNQIRESILLGRLKPGDRLPSEQKLMEQFGVSRFTLREALSALETLGFVEIRKGAGGGPVVKEVAMDVARDSIANFLHFQKVSVADLSEIRKVIEPYLAGQMAQDISDEDIEYLSALNDACAATLDRGEEIIGGEHEIDFHVHMARASGNPVLIMILDFVNKLLADLKLDMQPGAAFSRQVVADHERILQALRNRDKDAAAQAMYEHVANVEAAMQHIEDGNT